MIFNPAIDSIADVLAIRKQCFALLQQGLITTTWNIQGTSVGKIMAMPVKDMLRETEAFLQLAAPATYGQRIKRTTPFYSAF